MNNPVTDPIDVTEELVARFRPVNEDVASPYYLHGGRTYWADNSVSFYISKDDGTSFEVNVKRRAVER